MNVYVAWTDEDYYGPDPVEPHVFATLEAAQRAIDERLDAGDEALRIRGLKARNHGEWGPDPLGDALVRRGHFYIEEIEVAT